MGRAFEFRKSRKMKRWGQMSANMPKDNVERAIKKASGKNTEDWEERVYEGYAQYGIAILVETLTDNSTRTVANVRACFNKCDGTLGTTGSLDFAFERKCMFKIDAEGINLEEFEFEMIDHGAEEIDKDEEENEIIIYGQFTDFGNIQSALEEKGVEIKEANLERVPLETKTLTEEEEEEVNKLIERLEDEDDVQQVFHTMA